MTSKLVAYEAWYAEGEVFHWVEYGEIKSICGMFHTERGFRVLDATPQQFDLLETLDPRECKSCNRLLERN